MTVAPLKIAQIDLQYPYTAAERHVLLLSKGLRDRGHTVHLFCNPNGKLSQYAQEAGLPRLAVGARGQLDLKAAVQLAAGLRRLRPDVVHLHTSTEHIAGSVAAALAQAGVTVITRERVYPANPLVRLMCARAQRVICTTTVALDMLRRQSVPESRLALIPAAIDAGEYVAAASDGTRDRVRREMALDPDVTVLTVIANLTQAKGHRHLLEALARHAAGSRLHLLIVGDGPERGGLESLAQQLGLAQTTSFLDTRRELAPLLAATDILVQPSLWEEAPGDLLLQAMAAGCAVIASRAGGAAETVVEGAAGLLVPPRNVDALARAINDLIADPDRRRGMGEAGRRRVLDEFSAAVMVEKTEAVYRDAIAARRELTAQHQ